ncbi:Type II secretion system (T2SS), protein F [Pseudobutyrivibrio sp. NOR37]|uniref:Type II secretion system F family protein n=1 Tax=Pseudobutyrivibrio xylanivorans TaxID=185007 RepID=A0A6M0LHA8_PSEXY|nr:MULTISPECIES: type II secretion system F family protein [Pseudobutyrivibrio]NEX01914.1 type II secretion system F family protein [Pseudobutyrivibrio xylanivorans]SFR72744.1 Type II secretion system (T2SS), protein F [Pseudobutyrivibrio sp. NOR37]
MISKSNNKSQPINTKIILTIVVIVGVLILLYDYKSAKKDFAGIIPRNESGGPKVNESLEVEFLDQNQEVTLEVSAKGLKEKDIEKAFSDAVKEIDKTYLGKNKSADRVSDNLNLRDTYANGLVEVEWNFDVYGYISAEGILDKEKIPEEGQLVTLTAIMYCQDREQIYSFCVVVVPKGMDTLEGQLNAIEKAVKNQDEKTMEDDNLILPTKVETMDIKWSRKMDYRGLQLIILGFVCVGALSIGKKRDAKKEKEKSIADMDMDYPMIVSELSILMGAGMSFRKALERIVLKYTNNVRAGKTEIRPGFEQMVITYRRMSDGLSEIQAIEELGMKCESKNYRKLSMLLSQNLRKGSKDLIDCLEKEQQNAFELRKQRAIRAGEEASTKLLIPMAGMLFIVIVILVVPAVLQINI